MSATVETPLPPLSPPYRRLSPALERLLRPAVGFSHPNEVLKDPLLDIAEKRRILSSWASDASAVEDRPTLRWLLGTEAPVPLLDVLDALRRLDRMEGAVSLVPADTADRRAPRRSRAGAGTSSPAGIRPSAPG